MIDCIWDDSEVTSEYVYQDLATRRRYVKTTTIFAASQQWCDRVLAWFITDLKHRSIVHPLWDVESCCYNLHGSSLPMGFLLSFDTIWDSLIFNLLINKKEGDKVGGSVWRTERPQTIGMRLRTKNVSAELIPNERASQLTRALVSCQRRSFLWIVAHYSAGWKKRNSCDNFGITHHDHL